MRFEQRVEVVWDSGCRVRGRVRQRGLGDRSVERERRRWR